MVKNFLPDPKVIALIKTPISVSNTPTDGQVPTYNATTKKWEAQDPQGGSIEQKTFYVDDINGNDDNDGETFETPFKTVEKALSMTDKNKNVNIEAFLSGGTEVTGSISDLEFFGLNVSENPDDPDTSVLISIDIDGTAKVVKISENRGNVNFDFRGNHWEYVDGEYVDYRDSFTLSAEDFEFSGQNTDEVYISDGRGSNEERIFGCTVYADPTHYAGSIQHPQRRVSSYLIRINADYAKYSNLSIDKVDFDPDDALSYVPVNVFSVSNNRVVIDAVDSTVVTSGAFVLSDCSDVKIGYGVSHTSETLAKGSGTIAYNEGITGSHALENFGDGYVQNPQWVLDKVSVTADGVKTYSELLVALDSLVDRNRVTPKSIMELESTANGYKFYFQLERDAAGLLVFTKLYTNANGRVNADLISVGSSNTGYRTTLVDPTTGVSTVTSRNTEVPEADSVVITFIY